MIHLRAVQSHLRAVTDVASQREDQQAADLCSLMGYYLQLFGDYTEARRYYERAIAICQAVGAEDTPYIGAMYKFLGSLLDEQGQYDRALDFYQRALAIFELFRRAPTSPLINHLLSLSMR